MSPPYYVWRCPECKRQLYCEFEDLICPEHGNSFEEPERIEVVVPEEGLTDAMVSRAHKALNAAECGYDWSAAREALLAAGSWTDRERIADLEARCRALAEAAIADEAEIERLSRKLDREKMIEIVESFNPGWSSSEDPEAIVDALLEETA